MLLLRWGSVPPWQKTPCAENQPAGGTIRLFSPHHFVMMYIRQRASCGLPNLKRSQEKERAQKCWKKEPFCAQGAASNTGNEHKFAVSCPASESAVPRSASSSLPHPHLENPELKANIQVLKNVCRPPPPTSPVFSQSCVNLTWIVSGFILTSVSYRSSHIKLNPMNSGLVLNFKPEALTPCISLGGGPDSVIKC